MSAEWDAFMAGDKYKQAFALLHRYLPQDLEVNVVVDAVTEKLGLETPFWNETDPVDNELAEAIDDGVDRA